LTHIITRRHLNFGTSNAMDNCPDVWWSVECRQQISSVDYVDNSKRRRRHYRPMLRIARNAVARCLPVCLSGCPSHAGILSKWLNILANLFPPSGMGPRKHGQEGHLSSPGKRTKVRFAIKVRFALFTTFWFTQKVPKSLPQDTFHGSTYT